MKPSAWIVLTLLCLLGTNARAADCATLAHAGRQAYEQGDTERLKALLPQVEDCSPELRVTLRRRTAELLWNALVARHQAGAPPAALEAALHEVVRFAPLWQAHAALGDLRAEADEHARATEHYQMALDAMNDTGLTPNEPPLAVIESVFRKAERSRLLADRYVPTTVTRNRQPGGLASSAIRSFTPSRTAVPVEFRFDSVELTAKGHEAGLDMVDYLTRQEVAAITLIGHADPSHALAETDPAAAARYNRALSQRRAEALAEFLREQGFGGRIRTEGRGHDEPLAVDEPQRYSREALYRMYRRVELQRD